MNTSHSLCVPTYPQVFFLWITCTTKHLTMVEARVVRPNQGSFITAWCHLSHLHSHMFVTAETRAGVCIWACQGMLQDPHVCGNDKEERCSANVLRHFDFVCLIDFAWNHHQFWNPTHTQAQLPFPGRENSLIESVAGLRDPVIRGPYQNKPIEYFFEYFGYSDFEGVLNICLSWS